MSLKDKAYSVVMDITDDDCNLRSVNYATKQITEALEIGSDIARIEALNYIDGWITHHLCGPKVPAYIAAMEEIRCHIRAAIERIQLGKGMEATSELM